MSMYKRITVPLPEYDIDREDRIKEEPSCFINRNRVSKHNVNFVRINTIKIDQILEKQRSASKK